MTTYRVSSAGDNTQPADGTWAQAATDLFTLLSTTIASWALGDQILVRQDDQVMSLAGVTTLPAVTGADEKNPIVIISSDVSDNFARSVTTAQILSTSGNVRYGSNYSFHGMFLQMAATSELNAKNRAVYLDHCKMVYTGNGQVDVGARGASYVITNTDITLAGGYFRCDNDGGSLVMIGGSVDGTMGTWLLYSGTEYGKFKFQAVDFTSLGGVAGKDIILDDHNSTVEFEACAWPTGLPPSATVGNVALVHYQEYMSTDYATGRTFANRLIQATGEVDFDTAVFRPGGYVDLDDDTPLSHKLIGYATAGFGTPIAGIKLSKLNKVTGSAITITLYVNPVTTSVTTEEMYFLAFYYDGTSSAWEVESTRAILNPATINAGAWSPIALTTSRTVGQAGLVKVIPFLAKAGQTVNVCPAFEIS